MERPDILTDEHLEYLDASPDLELRFLDKDGDLVGFAPWVADYYGQRRRRDYVEDGTGAVVARITWGEK